MQEFDTRCYKNSDRAEEKYCPNCGPTTFKAEVTRDTTGNPFSLFRCGNCLNKFTRDELVDAIPADTGIDYIDACIRLSVEQGNFEAARIMREQALKEAGQ